MTWSLKIGRFSGIDVYMHFTFILLVSWVAYVNWRQGQSIAAAVAGVTFILAIFLCVVLHEFGHFLPARLFGDEAGPARFLLLFLSAFAAPLTARLARPLIGRVGAILAGAFVALYAPAVFYGAELLPASIVLLLNLCTNI